MSLAGSGRGSNGPGYRPAVLAYKFLDGNGRTYFSGFAWPLPTDGAPGEWVESAAVRPSYEGVHACRGDQLAFWLTPNLWEIELDGEVVEATHKIVAPRGRLVRHVEEWTAVGREHAERCGWRARSLAVEALRRAGADGLADRLDGYGSLADIAQAASLVADGDPDDAVTRLVTLVGDSGRAGGNGSIVGAPFVSACAAATVAELLGGPADQQAAFHAERREQSAWLSAALAAAR
jgi:hypothetical protein